MEKHELVIIGGSAGGAQVAICAQEHHNLDDLVVIRREKKVMVPCGIPYIYGTLDDVDSNIMPDGVMGKVKIKVGEVVSIERGSKILTLSDGEKIGYNKLVLATGSNPVQPPIAGMDKKNVYVVKKEHSHLREMAKAMESARHIVVIGGGFIGIEFADECRKRGHEVTVVELLEHCLRLVCTDELCSRVEGALEERGVNIITGSAVQSIGGTDEVEFVQLDNGREIKCDMVIVGIGVVPNTKLAEDAGLEIGTMRGIEVDEFQGTSDPDIFAVGDCAEKYSFFNGEPVAIRLASVATREGKIAAINLYSRRWRNVGTIGGFATVVGDMAVGAAGLTSAQAIKMGYSVVIGEADTVSKHPGTMPDAQPIRVNLVFDRRSGKLIGGCACCAMTVGEMVNLIIAGIVNGMTMEQLALFPMGTHPQLTASPLVYPLTDAASDALHKAISNV
ncbi:MAG: FAD-dependent oxidoreductase [Dehalococcoidia bacterium]|nr:FAD-dependent oxidoreductase [Dehalococcoidia bacterium]